jgi:RNA polymerase sigma-70 factor (ECF subfamily)
LDINDLQSRAREGDLDAEKRLMAHLTVRFRRFTYQRIRNSEIAREIVQEALIVISENYKNIEFEVSFSTWAYKVLLNKILNYSKKERSRGNNLLKYSTNHIKSLDWTPDPEFEISLLNCLKKICQENNRYARILNFKYQGFKSEEICKKLDITLNNYYVILSRARSMLKKCLKGGDGEDE